MGTANKVLSIIRILLITVAVVLLIMLVGRLTGLADKFAGLRSGGLAIDKTENVVSQIRKIAEFTTGCFYEETVLKERKYGPSISSQTKKMVEGSPLGDILEGAEGSFVTGELAIIVKGKVRAGFDLSSFSKEDMTFAGDTLKVKLPEAVVFDIIVNPSDVEIFHRSGTWSDSEIKAVLSSARSVIGKDAAASGILEKATKSGQEKLIRLFQNAGFKNVVLE